MRACICPSCRASLSIKGDNRDFAFCEYCGTKIMLDDYRSTRHIVDEARLRRVEAEQEKARFVALQSQRREILEQWDLEQEQDEAKIAKAKDNLDTCLLFCLLVIGIYALPYYLIKYNCMKIEYEKKKKHRDYLRALPLDLFFQQLEMEWRSHKKEDEINPFSFL